MCLALPDLPIYPVDLAPPTVFGRWIARDEVPSVVAHCPSLYQCHRYELVVLPQKPILVGERLKVVALTPAWYHDISAKKWMVETYDPHVIGTVAGIAAIGTASICLYILNECAWNPVGRVNLVIPFIPGMTVTVPNLARVGLTSNRYPRVADVCNFDPRLRIMLPYASMGRSSYNCLPSAPHLRYDAMCSADPENLEDELL